MPNNLIRWNQPRKLNAWYHQKHQWDANYKLMGKFREEVKEFLGVEISVYGFMVYIWCWGVEVQNRKWEQKE